MSLTTLAAVQAIPGMQNASTAYLQQLIDGADAAIKTFCKWQVEQMTVTEYLDGKNSPELWLRRPWVKSVTSLYLDQTGYYGQSPSAFPTNSLMTAGTQYALEYDTVEISPVGVQTQVSARGLLVRLGYQGTTGSGSWIGLMPEVMRSGKLAAGRTAVWPWGKGNVKVVYVSGYSPVPADISYACAALVAGMVRNQPSGGPLSSESLGAYSYNVLSQALEGNLPELSHLGTTLRRYREIVL